MWALLTSFITALLIAPLTIAVYTKQGWVDNPKVDSHIKKTHTMPVPRGGGIVIFGAFLISTLLFLQFDKHLIAILLAALLLTIVGTLDDIFDISPKIRLVTGLIAAAVVVASGIGIAYVTNPFAQGVIHLNQPQIALFVFGKMRTVWILADIFALFFILWNMNIVNWSKGVDGQLPSFVSVAMLVIALLSSRFVDDPTLFDTATFSMIIAGAYLGLLVWNWYPQKMMPGYGAGSLAGFFLGVAAIISGAKIATVLIVLGLPTADAVFTILRRLFRKKSPLLGDRGHFHHVLLDYYGYSRKQISLLYVASSLLLGGAALYLNTAGKMITMLLIFTIVFGVHIYARKTKKARRR
ncbi:MAG: undecaprenyl/decaprenyl-phosphate alpha-N-acetylglucosaminyl 1-phosphate transferase [Candidatus Pacebacteria bacterium]|nr:undecaprenyl/decaprenyl-phosphate alpha-N-acetylglucosaminyl 1-phosphate transferase [Candidatus Paceibacterota bacterium]PIR63183.1 MAG: hypothetical protein COU64_05705 [Candidatus Pacebacteria bacterium CG10_big_fil_rev_8_21_14_0_10_40_26]PIZ78213.1 MAG: hypothetical protein COY01_05525 [Candidatus Pacebacteria bacterium CG_4_10_14_0_2_um_filter_40_20]PJA68742.1 MAG: hypothetical protein CO156_04520 [Candidatus Pacebacteria bacterium CG_4_9_14_3_um_filter_40_12]PJC41682.1 MAG: hypothetica